MPHLQKLWDEFKGRGLHIYHVESQNHSPEAIRKFCEARGVTFPQVERIPVENDFHSYELGSRVPYAYVVGVDGTVIHQGASGYREVIRDEMKKVRYPGLGKQQVSKPAEQAARQYGQRSFGKAVVTATKALTKLRADDDPDTAAIEDAQLVIARAERLGGQLMQRAKHAMAEREYMDAMSLYRQISREFKGHELGKSADLELKSVKKDKTFQKELKALISLEKLLAKLATVEDVEARKKALEKFAEKNDGTKAAEKARAR